MVITSTEHRALREGAGAAGNNSGATAHHALSLMYSIGWPVGPPPVLTITPSTTMGGSLSTLSIGEPLPGG